MMHALVVSGTIIGSLYALWFFFLASMSLMRAYEQGTMSLPAKVLGAPILVIGLIIDCLLNVLVFSIVFLERPREWTASIRFGRMIREGKPWQKRTALWICVNLLDVFDPDGVHCKR